nr:LEAF RUST 10 DISEASE-RESISTANCE LOCUS RECEPTOR-LIKE PROTEIN KINASE-like 2.1 isoform X2 [Malus domestica]
MINVHVMNILLRMIMPDHLFLTLPIFFVIFNLLIVVPSAIGDGDFRYTECSSYYDCGLLKNISYPFWATSSRPQHCGREDYELTCRGDQYPVMKIKDQDFLVLNFSGQFYTMTIARSDLWGTPCTANFVNTTLDYDRFSYVPAVRNLSLFYGCPPQSESVLSNFTCKVEGTDHNISYYVDDSLSRIRLKNWASCHTNIRVPIMWEGVDAMPLENVTTGVLKEVLKQGFQVAYDAEWELCNRCLISNGICGSNSSSDSFVCYCGDGPYDQTCSIPGDNAWNWKRKVIVAALSAGSGIMICVIVCCIKARKQIFKRSNDQDLEAFIRANGPLAVKRYKFLEIRKMTKSFKDKLGQGGYGDVYKGNLLDGSPVAVKVLKSSKGNGEDFINEVLSISRTSHVNVVTLLGYCFEGQKKALIYEFMPNGSLEKYVYNENALQTSSPQLEVEQLLDIVTGIARGLEYLHRGCNTRILHFDIKPHNILLDENFCPKISDFGLSKLFLKKESIMSMLDARGTIGYIAPEVFCRNFGGVSVKSDVYSYGMMVLELVEGRKNINARASHTSDVYFPDWVYKKLEAGSSLGLPNGVTEEENELARKMILVGLWCIQTKPSDRPSMSRVIEMLQGSIEALQIPPKPVLTFPVRTPPESSTLSLTHSFLD